ncbi:MAG: hypothetical protein HN348_05365 [Proteobacteria bacterium]|nr:hypothetical protein [Pseudomonadota bacterium]
MGDFIVVDLCMVMWNPAGFLPAVIAPIPTVIKGTAKKVKVCKKKVCQEGAEKKVKAMGCVYMNPPGYPIPGVGVLKVKKLKPKQYTKKTKVEKKKAILKGIMFDAIFEVMAPAMQLPPPASGGAPDGKKKYIGGHGMFMELVNLKVKAS